MKHIYSYVLDKEFFFKKDTFDSFETSINTLVLRFKTHVRT